MRIPEDRFLDALVAAAIMQACRDYAAVRSDALRRRRTGRGARARRRDAQRRRNALGLAEFFGSRLVRVFLGRTPSAAAMAALGCVDVSRLKRSPTAAERAPSRGKEAMQC